MRVFRLCFSIVSLCLVFVTTAVSQGLPGRLTFISSPAFSLTIESPTYSPANQSSSGTLSGTGTYTIAVGGQPAFTATNFPFDGILADSTGKVSTNAVGYALKADVNWKNAMGAGVDLLIPAGSHMIVSTSNLIIKGSATAMLPYRVDGGNRATASLPTFTLTVGLNGSVVIDSGMTIAGGPPLKVAGFEIDLGPAAGKVDAHLTLANPATAATKNHLLLVTFADATLKTPIPGLSAGSSGIATAGDLALEAKNLAIDEGGLPTADSIALSQIPQVNTNFSPNDQIISLVQPLNFAIRPTAIKASVQDGVFSLSTLTFDLLLPSAFSDDAGQRSIVPNVTLTGSGQITVPAIPGGVFHLDWGIPNIGKLKASITAFKIDPKIGITNVSGTVALGGGSAITGASGPIQLSVKDLTVSASGITGDFSLTNGSKASIWSMPVTLDEGGISLQDGKLVAADFSATYDEVFKLGLRIGLSKTGVSVGVESGSISPVGWGAATMQITGGNGTLDQNGKGTLYVSGQISLPAMGPIDTPIVLDFTDLGIQNGALIAEAFKIAKPVNVDLGPATLHLSALSYQASPVQLTLTGDVKFPDIFGGSGQVSFDGLQISPATKSVTVKGIGINAAIPGLGTFGATFDPGAPTFNGFDKPFVGKAQVQIEGLPGFDADILLAQKSWLLGLNASIPPVPLAPPPGSPSPPFLYLLGVNGALGYGVGVKEGNNNPVPDSVEMPFRNYQAVPGNFFIQAGVDIGTIDQYLLWGNLTFSGGFPAVQLDLRGDMYLLQDRATSRNNPDPSRKAYFEMLYKAPDQFYAQGNIDITLLKDLPIYHLKGGLQAQFTPDRGFFYAGYPVDPNGYGFDVLGVGQKQGLGIDLWPSHGIDFEMEQYADLFGFIDLKRGFDISATLNTSHSASFSAQANFYAYGSIDFGVITAFARVDVGASITLPAFKIDPVGHFEAGIHTFLGDISVDTGDVHLLGS